MIIERIAEDIIIYEEDHPHIQITLEMIKQLIDEYKEDIVKEIINEVIEKGGRI